MRAANGLAADANKQPLFFTKENTSNGDIATVDVFFPMDPIWSSQPIARQGVAGSRVDVLRVSALEVSERPARLARILSSRPR